MSNRDLSKQQMYLRIDLDEKGIDYLKEEIIAKSDTWPEFKIRNKIDIPAILDVLNITIEELEDIVITEKRLEMKESVEFKKEYEEEIESEDKKIRVEFLQLTSGMVKQWAEATELLVDYIKEKLYIYTTKDDVRSEVWIYKEGIYVPQGKSEIKIILRNLLKDWYSQYVFNLVINKIEVDTYIDIDEFFLFNHEGEIAVQNGILNVFTRELQDFSHEKVFFSKIPVKYEEEALCPKIDEFLNNTLACKEDRLVMYELGGFCLMNGYKYEKAAMFVGSGRNGKDKTLELIKRTLGMDNCCSIPLTSLTPESFSIAELFGKKANLAGEIGNQDLKDCAMFKALTGRSLVSANRKFLKKVTFVNSAKFIFACNELPMVYDLSKGFWDRWILLEFPYTFVTEEEFKKAKCKENLKIRDEDIIDKITLPTELSGLLNGFLDGVDRLESNRNFSVTDGSEDVKNKWIRKANSFVAFAMDKIEEDYDGKITKKVLRKEYSKYCKIHKVTSKSDYVIKSVLQQMFGSGEGTASIGINQYERVWEGIKLR